MRSGHEKLNSKDMKQMNEDVDLYQRENRKLHSVLEKLKYLSLIKYNDCPQRCRAELQKRIKYDNHQYRCNSYI